MKPVAHIEGVHIRASATDDCVTALVEKNNILVVEDQRKLEAAIAAGITSVVLTRNAAIYIIKKQKKNRNIAICCFIIALILVIAFGIAMGEWRSSSNEWETNANQLQSSVVKLRDELQSDVFYTDYDKLVEKCLGNTYSVCYDVGIKVILSNPSYGDYAGAVVSLAKDPKNNGTQCIVDYSYRCIIRDYSYVDESSDNCRASEYQINTDCQAILTDSYDSCSSYEISRVSNGGSYYSASDSCEVNEVLEQFENGYEVSCNDCAVVIELENVIKHSQSLF